MIKGVDRLDHKGGIETSDVLEIVAGGITGYEAFYLSDTDFMKFEVAVPWLACAGTYQRWDSL